MNADGLAGGMRMIPVRARRRFTRRRASLLAHLPT
jgi:hypothetical protein